MSIKVFAVDGEKLAGRDAPTQDLVLAAGTTFPSGTAAGFLRDGTAIGKATPLQEGVQSAVSSPARNLNRVMHAVGTESAMADFFGHPFGHPLAEPCSSQAPLRFGDHVAELGAFPTGAALGAWRLDPRADEGGLRHAAVATLGAHDVVFGLRAQLWTDAATQPVEDASVEWKTAESPDRTVATITLPRQRIRRGDDVPAGARAGGAPAAGVGDAGQVAGVRGAVGVPAPGERGGGGEYGHR